MNGTWHFRDLHLHFLSNFLAFFFLEAHSLHFWETSIYILVFTQLKRPYLLDLFSHRTLIILPIFEQLESL